MHFWFAMHTWQTMSPNNGVDGDKSDVEEFLKDKDVHDLRRVLKGVQKWCKDPINDKQSDSHVAH